MRYFKLAYMHYRPYAFGCTLICIGMALQTAFRVALPIGYQHLFDTAVMKEGAHTLSSILTLLLAGWVIYVLAGGLFAFYSVRVGLSILSDVRGKMFRQLQRLSESYFSDSHSGDLMSRFTNDLAIIEKVLVRSVYTAVFSAVLLLVSLFTLFFIEWRLACVTFAMLALALVGPRVLGRWSHDKNLHYQKQQGKVASMVSESIGGQAIVRAFDLRDFRFSHFKEQQGVLTDRGTMAYFSGSLVGLSSSMTVLVVQIAIMGIGAYLVSSGAMTPGALVGFIALLLTIGNASNYLSQVSPELLQGSVSVQRVQEFLGEETAEIEKPQDIDLEQVVGNVRFEEVSFSYDESVAALHELNFEIQSGESVAIVGPSGSGKSTVLQLLLRSYRPREGRITLDDYDLCSITESSLRNRIGYVPQESVLFSSSLIENIRMGNLEASDEEVVAAAKLAEIHDAILTMPDQYDTIVGERGSRLSGGQRQRIALARALLRKPDVLLLDEATSALDPATEQAINRTLEKLKGTCMVISATHRLQGLVKMDRIMVMDQGCVVEEGLHKPLLERKGLYYKLWLKQSGFTISEDGYRAACEPERLKKIPLFAKVSDTSLHKISDALVSEFYPKDRLVFSQGDPGDKFYILVHGGVVVEVRKASYRGPITVHLDDGDIFGEMALLHAQPRNATVRTTRPTLLLSLDRQQFGLLMAEEPSLRQAIEEVAKERRSQNNRNSYLELAAG